MNTLPDWKAWSFRALVDRFAVLGIQAQRFAAVMVLTVLTTLVVTNTAQAQSNVTGSIAGKASGCTTALISNCRPGVLKFWTC